MNPLVWALIKKIPVIGDMINAFERKEDDNDNSFRNKPRSNVNPRNQKQRYNPQF